MAFGIFPLREFDDSANDLPRDHCGAKPPPESAPSYGRLKGRTTRSYSVSTKLTREEFDAVANASRDCGKTIGEWARETILQQARGGAAQVPNEALMVELWGMYLFLLNALSPLVRGETITAERYQSIIDKIRDVKYKAAIDAIASYHAKRKNTSTD